MRNSRPAGAVVVSLCAVVAVSMILLSAERGDVILATVGTVQGPSSPSAVLQSASSEVESNRQSIAAMSEALSLSSLSREELVAQLQKLRVENKQLSLAKNTKAKKANGYSGPVVSRETLLAQREHEVESRSDALDAREERIKAMELRQESISKKIVEWREKLASKERALDVKSLKKKPQEDYGALQHEVDGAFDNWAKKQGFGDPAKMQNFDKAVEAKDRHGNAITMSDLDAAFAAKYAKDSPDLAPVKSGGEVSLQEVQQLMADAVVHQARSKPVVQRKDAKALGAFFGDDVGEEEEMAEVEDDDHQQQQQTPTTAPAGKPSQVVSVTATTQSDAASSSETLSSDGDAAAPLSAFFGDVVDEQEYTPAVSQVDSSAKAPDSMLEQRSVVQTPQLQPSATATTPGPSAEDKEVSKLDSVFDAWKKKNGYSETLVSKPPPMGKPLSYEDAQKLIAGSDPSE